MTFEESLAQAIALLQRRRRLRHSSQRLYLAPLTRHARQAVCPL